MKGVRISEAGREEIKTATENIECPECGKIDDWLK
jgi:hypothetical protein